MRLFTIPRCGAALMTMAMLSGLAGCSDAPSTTSSTTEPAATVTKSIPAATAGASPPVAAQVQPSVPAVPSFDFTGTWVDNKASCVATDFYMHLGDDGRAHLFGQDGRWSARPGAIAFDMEAAEASEISDAQRAWSAVVKVTPRGKDAMTVNWQSGQTVTYHRCPD